MSFLEKIRPAKEAEVSRLRAAYAAVAPTRLSDDPVRDFAGALRGGDRVIAEIKHKSPSHPEFVQPASPPTLARAYRRGGAAALSIVTDEAHFGTSLADVAAVRGAVSLPVIVKDFVIDETQLTAAWAAGADAALLIVSMLDAPTLSALIAHGHDLGLHLLVECHSRSEIELAATAGARIIGVNNRNLATLTTDLAHGASLMPYVPDSAIRVSESGLYRRGDIERMADCGADAFLVGHALLQSRDPGRQVAQLCGREDEQRLRVKTCGITNVADAELAHRAGAAILGLIFAPSDRRIDLEQAHAIRQGLPDARLCGVFVDEAPERIQAIATACDLDLIQLHGHESPEDCGKLRSLCGLPLIKALTPIPDIAATAKAYTAAAYVLIDLPKGRDKQGLTRADCVAAARELTAAGHQVFLAGGLDPDNVGDCATESLFAVDVASGIESEPGIKNRELTRSFILEATR